MFAINAIFACDMLCSNDTHMHSNQQCFTIKFSISKRLNVKIRYVNF